MRRLFFPCLASVLVAAACDPELEIIKAGTDAGVEAGPSPGPGPGPGPTDGGDPEDSGTETDATTIPDAGKPHVVDGIDDFAPGEKLPTTSLSTGYEAFIAWDATRVYFGMSGPDVGAGGTNPQSRWVMVYLGTEDMPGTTTGITYDGEQQPSLPFAASVHLRWKADGTFSDVQVWDGDSWEPANPALFPIVAARQGTMMEMSITRASMGNPTSLKVHMNMLIEGELDHTYAGVPSTSFVDGKDPDFTKYFEFDLGSATPPNQYAPKP